MDHSRVCRARSRDDGDHMTDVLYSVAIGLGWAAIGFCVGVAAYRGTPVILDYISGVLRR